MRTDAAGSGVTDLRSWACSAAGAMQPANQAGRGRGAGWEPMAVPSGSDVASLRAPPPDAYLPAAPPTAAPRSHPQANRREPDTACPMEPIAETTVIGTDPPERVRPA